MANEVAAPLNQRVVGVWVGDVFGVRLDLECKPNGRLVVVWDMAKSLLGTWSVSDDKVELSYGNNREPPNRASGSISGDRFSGQFLAGLPQEFELYRK